MPPIDRVEQKSEGFIFSWVERSRERERVCVCVYVCAGGCVKGWCHFKGRERSVLAKAVVVMVTAGV